MNGKFSNVFNDPPVDEEPNTKWFPYWWLYTSNQSFTFTDGSTVSKTVPIGEERDIEKLAERKQFLEERFQLIGEKLDERLRARGLIPKDAIYLYCANSDALFQFLINHAEKLIRGINPPEVILPHLGRNDSKFAVDLINALPKDALFRKEDSIVTIFNEVASEGWDDNGLVRGGFKFKTMLPTAFTVWVEGFLIVGKNVGKDENLRFSEKTMSEAQAARVLANPKFIQCLTRINRILDVPIPLVRRDGEITFPTPEYNPSFEVYLNPAAPVVKIIPLPDALEIITSQVYEGFCFKDDQSRTHAIARLITPYVRGIIGFENRIPLWYYAANRPGAGKDYCAGVTQIIYQGRPFEDVPIGEYADETCKRITAALVAGRRVMHFANCQVHLSDQYLIQAVTGSTFNARMLGSTGAKSDLELPNEIDFSLSANTGVTCKEDIERRTRRIDLEFFGEDENARVFPKQYLHDWLKINRSLILSAIHTLFVSWVDAGKPSKSTFTSFPKWAEVVGGILMFHNLGDPCLPHKDSGLGGDLRTRAMTALYELAYETDPETPLSKQEIFALIDENQSRDDRLEWFGNLTDGIQSVNNRSKTGIALKSFDHRVLSGVAMYMDTSASKASRHSCRFSKCPF